MIHKRQTEDSYKEDTTGDQLQHFCAVILSVDIVNKHISNEHKTIITDHKEHKTINLWLLYDRLKP